VEYGTVSTGGVRYRMFRRGTDRKHRRGTVPDVQAGYGTGCTCGVRYRKHRRGTVPDVQAEYLPSTFSPDDDSGAGVLQGVVEMME